MGKQHRFGIIETIFLLFLVLLIAIAGFFVIEHKHKSPSTNITSVKNGEVRLRGKITADDCFMNGTASNNGGHGLPIGDVGCSITVNGTLLG